MKTITQTIVKAQKEKTTVVLCDNCKANSKETVLEETGFPNIVVKKRSSAELFVSFMVDDDGEICEAADCEEFSKELSGDWCQDCARNKLLEFLATD